jgi:ribosome-binding factor A
MPESSFRMRRVNEALKEILSDAISLELKDPRIGFVTVTGVSATPDLRHAKVYLSVLGPQAQKESTLLGLRSAEGFLQGIINEELHLKRTPALQFVYDESVDRGMKIEAMLRGQERDLGVDISSPAAGTDPAAGEGPEGAADPAVEREET